MVKDVDTRHARPALSKKGVTSQDKGVYVSPEHREPTDPQNLHRSKAQFIAHQEAKKRKAAAMAKLSKDYDERKDEETLKPTQEEFAIELTEQIEGLTKLHPATEKSLWNKIDKIADEDTREGLLNLLESKKKSLKDK